MGALLHHRPALPHPPRGERPRSDRHHRWRSGGTEHRGRSPGLHRCLPAALPCTGAARPAAFHRWPGGLLRLRHRALHRAAPGPGRKARSAGHPGHPAHGLRRGGGVRQPHRAHVHHRACRSRKGRQLRIGAEAHHRAGGPAAWRLAPAGGGPAPLGAGVGLRLRVHRGGVQGSGGAHQGIHRGGGLHAGGDLPAPLHPLSRAAPGPLPCPAGAQPLALHVFPRFRRFPGGGLLARDPGAAGGRRGDGASHRGHPSAWPHRGGGSCPGGGAARRSQGAGRAPDAHRPGAQRRGPGCQDRQRAPHRQDDRGTLLSRHAYRLQRGGRTAGGHGCHRRAACHFPRRHRLRCAQDPGHGDHRRAGAGEAGRLFRRRGLSLLERQHGHRHRHPHRRDQGWPAAHPGGCRGGGRFRSRAGVEGDHEQGAGGVPRRGPGRGGAGAPRLRDGRGGLSHAADDRQLRLLHLQPGAVFRRTGRRGEGGAQRRGEHRRHRGHGAEAAGDLSGALHAQRGGRLGGGDKTLCRQAAHPRRLPRPPVHRPGVRGEDRSRQGDHARQDLAHLSQGHRGLHRPGESFPGHPLPFAGDREEELARLPGGDRLDRPEG